MSDETKNDLPVETEDTVGTALDVVADFALDQSIPPPIRKGLWAAAKRLGTALVETPAGYLERRSAEKWAETEARVKIIEESGDQIRQQIEIDPEFPQRASNTFARQILREQLNREKVLGITTNILKKKRYDDSENQQTGSEQEKTISEDWFNIFEKEASQKSTEEMQRRFAQVLAGEIEKPGSHSIKAVKALGNMDQGTAELFQRLCSMSVVLEDLVDKRIHDLRVSSLGGKPGQNDLRKYGLDFSQINMLIEYDLVTPNFNTLYGYQSCILDMKENAANPFRHQGRYWILKPFPEHPKKNGFRLSGVQLSSVGSQLFHIIEQIPTQQYTNDLKEYFKTQQLEMVEVSIEKGGQRWHFI